MNPPRQSEEAIFDAAVQLPPEQRTAYLAQACGDNAALRQRAEALLQAHEKAGGPLDQPAAPAPGKTIHLSIPLTEKPGDKIGHYKLLQQIGEGGCGAVYMAEQEQPIRRRVAFKVIKLGMDTREVIARFEAERQALALMDHPNIARVLDAGATETGRPFFVMELVRGIKITEYCDQNQLCTEERLALFTQVCHAIQHAHQKGIIHRDIKPSNILVTLHDGVPVPKVIDFGIAKATDQRLTDKTMFTRFEQFIGTPAYMSPEQAEMSGLDIDTRSDIYSLGVLLYELLTGRTPFDQKELLAAGLDEMRRTIREKEPVRPSTRLSTMLEGERTTTAKRRHTDAPRLVHLLRGDLDWIVMRALEKDRTRRYETANGLADDIKRYLNNDPVDARPPSKLYRFQKLVRRNKLVFAAAGAVTAALVLGLGLSTWMFFKEKQARRLADAAAVKSRQVAEFLKDMLQGVGPSAALGRDTTMLREVLDKTAERAGKDLKDQPEVEAELRNTMGEVYRALGQYEKAEGMHREALGLQKRVFGTDDLKLAPTLNNLALVLRDEGKLGEAETAQRDALGLQKELLGQKHLAVATSLNNLSLVVRDEGKLAEAETLQREALALQRELLGQTHPAVAVSLDNLANVLREQGKLAEAETVQREALAMQRKFMGEEHPAVAAALNNLAALLSRQGKMAEAETIHREALAMRRKLMGRNPEVAASLNNLALVLRDEAKSAEAESLVREALALQRELLGPKHPSLAVSLNNLALVLRDEGKLAEAEASQREALAMQRELLGDKHSSVAVSLNNLGAVLSKEGKLAEAEASFREALALRRSLFGDTNPAVASSLRSLVDVLMREGKYGEAEAVFSQLLTAAIAGVPQSAGLLSSRADFFARRGQWPQAAAAAAKVLEYEPADYSHYALLAPLLVASGELERYRQLCQQICSRFSGSTNPVVAGQMAQSCLLLPLPGVDLSLLSRWADMAITVGSSNRLLPAFQFTKGLAEYREGRFASATEWMRKTLDGAPDSPDEARAGAAWTVLALAEYQLKRNDAARADLSRGAELEPKLLAKLEGGDLGANWRTWLIGQTLTREAKALIQGGTEPNGEAK